MHRHPIGDTEIEEGTPLELLRLRRGEMAVVAWEDDPEEDVPETIPEPRRPRPSTQGEEDDDDEHATEDDDVTPASVRLDT